MPAANLKMSYINNNSVIRVPPSRLKCLLVFLRSHLLCQFKSLVDVAAYHLGNAFVIVYNLLSTQFNARMLVVTQILRTPLGPGGVPSALLCFASASWQEREVWDLYGVYFFRHLDLRKILTDYGFIHHPLRKDFPLSGYKEVSYNEKEKRTVYTSVEIPQQQRIFSFA
jgi:NADH:ubiquinone oxidoreductase subunit C